MFTYLLFIPNLPVDHSLASIHTSSAYALQHDTEFASDFSKGVNTLTTEWKKNALQDALDQRLYIQQHKKSYDTTRPWQGFSIDMAFAGQSRKDPSKYTEFVGLRGKKCWLLIKDHFTDFAIGNTFKSKTAQLNTLRTILIAFCPGTG